MEVEDQSNDVDTPSTSDDVPVKCEDDAQAASTSTETVAITSNVEMTSKDEITSNVEITSKDEITSNVTMTSKDALMMSAGDNATSSSDVAEESVDDSAKQVFNFQLFKALKVLFLSLPKSTN
jgi:molybdopterin-binding protein